jgi:hypothetical protein
MGSGALVIPGFDPGSKIWVKFFSILYLAQDPGPPTHISESLEPTFGAQNKLFLSQWLIFCSKI